MTTLPSTVAIHVQKLYSFLPIRDVIFSIEEGYSMTDVYEYLQDVRLHGFIPYMSRRSHGNTIVHIYLRYTPQVSL